MPILSLEILGYRGFSTNQRVEFGIPDGNAGSGLTVLVGANNTGKSSITECLRFFASDLRQPPSITEGRRNKRAGDTVSLRIAYEFDGHHGIRILRTANHGGSETLFEDAGTDVLLSMRVHGCPSRRYIEPTLTARGEFDRLQYAPVGAARRRNEPLNEFAYRLFRIQNNREAFDAVLEKIVNPAPKWTIDQNDAGNWYLKIFAGDAHHNTEGLGGGFVSLFFIIDALYDSLDGNMIVIDEPELSLHPASLRRLADLLCEYAKTRQIVIATHSPYFVTPTAMKGGATICRVYVDESGSRVSQLSPATTRGLVQLATKDANNPHVFGLDAREVFFLEECIILVEGQEDVLAYQTITSQLDLAFDGAFFGWGVGGAEKMRVIATTLRELGFQKVVGILDANKPDVKRELERDFTEYRFFFIPADDVRSKHPVSAKPGKEGLLDSGFLLKEEFREPMRTLIDEVNRFLTQPVQGH